MGFLVFLLSKYKAFLFGFFNMFGGPTLPFEQNKSDQASPYQLRQASQTESKSEFASECSRASELPMKTSPISFSFNIPKLENSIGEDAEPILLEVNSFSVLGVFDGLGGAGSHTYSYRNQCVSGAYIASSVTRRVCQEFVHSQLQSEEFPINSSTLKEVIVDCLAAEMEDLAKNLLPSRLRSKLLSRLPTTLSLCILHNYDGTGQLCVQVLWAGDSRCYALSPKTGLHQLSEDDLKINQDALENLKEDSPMSNYVNIDSNFSINSRILSYQHKTVFIVSTDGCFGYFPSPFHFEACLLESLIASSDMTQWKVNLIEKIKKVTSDDSSISIYAIGWGSFQELREDFLTRHSYIHDNYINLISRNIDLIKCLSSDIAELTAKKDSAEQEYQANLKSLWSIYKETYYGTQGHNNVGLCNNDASFMDCEREGTDNWNNNLIVPNSVDTFHCDGEGQ